MRKSSDIEVLNIPIPDWLYWKCGIFRASARMFYPVYYVIYTYILYQLAEMEKPAWALGILAAGIVIQGVDLSGVLLEKHQMMAENASYHSLLDEEELNAFIDGHEKVSLSMVWDIEEMRRIAVWAGKNGMKTSYTVANSGVYPEADAKLGEEIKALESGVIDDTIIYVTQDIDVYKNWLSKLDETKFNRYYYNDYYYIIPNAE